MVNLVYALVLIVRLYIILDYIFIASLLALSSLFVFLIWTMRDHLTIVWFWIVIICAATFAISYINIGLSVPGFASTRA